MGLPSLATTTAQIAAQDLATQGAKKGTPKGMPKGTPHKASRRLQQKVTMEAKRATSPPQKFARPLAEDGDVQMVNGVKITVEVNESEAKDQAQIEQVAPATKLARSKGVPRATKGTPDGDTVPTPEEPTDIVMVDLVKEKTSLTSSKKQLEEELRDVKAKLEKVTQEQDDARETVAKDADTIGQHL
ncbi:unnamed protein product [Calypogeia fissa]